MEFSGFSGFWKDESELGCTKASLPGCWHRWRGETQSYKKEACRVTQRVAMKTLPPDFSDAVQFPFSSRFW